MNAKFYYIQSFLANQCPEKDDLNANITPDYGDLSPRDNENTEEEDIDIEEIYDEANSVYNSQDTQMGNESRTRQTEFSQNAQSE